MGGYIAMIKESLAVVLTIFMLIPSLFFPKAPAEPSIVPLDAENLQAQFSVVSDIHLDIYWDESYVNRYTMLRKGLQDMASTAKPNDLFMSIGDNVEDAQIIEYASLYLYLKLYNKLPNTMIAMGNHETFKSETFAPDLASFLTSYNLYTGEKRKTSYYHKVINGYYYIVMGTEDKVGDQEYISPAQLEWLDKTMAEAAATGKPIFLFNHQIFEGTHSNNWDAGSIGEQNDAVYAIVSKYEDVFYFSGHLHHSLNETTYQTTPEGVHLLNLPSFGKDGIQGQGFQVEIYPDRVVMRARNFGEGKWIADYEITQRLD